MMIMIAADVVVIIGVVDVTCYACDVAAVVSMTVGYSSIHTICEANENYEIVKITHEIRLLLQSAKN